MRSNPSGVYSSRMSSPRHTVIVADDLPEMRNSVAKLLRPDFSVVAAVADGRALIEAHAWLRSGDWIVTGGDVSAKFTIVSTFAFGKGPVHLND